LQFHRRGPFDDCKPSGRFLRHTVDISTRFLWSKVAKIATKTKRESRRGSLLKNVAVARVLEIEPDRELNLAH
jgi:hypothetical protein